METTCVHTCNGSCNALEAAEHRQREVIQEYKNYLMQCDIPEVKNILSDMIEYYEKGLVLLKEKKGMLSAEIQTAHDINTMFE
mgnify:CR=1 FL=1